MRSYINKFLFFFVFISTSSIASSWLHYNGKEKMTGEIGSVSATESDNSINWMGYDSNLQFMIYEYKKSGKKIFVFFADEKNENHAMLSCYQCNALVKVDGESLFNIPLIESIDNPSGVFETIIPEEKLSKIMRAKKFLVQMPIIGQGKPIMEFNIKNPT